MYLEFKQTEQELYSAKFDILENGDTKVGQASIQGWLGGVDGEWNVEYRDRHLFIGSIADKELKNAHPEVYSTWRPVAVKEKDREGQVVGYAYQEILNQGLLKNLFGNMKSRMWVQLDGIEYEMFGVDPSLEENGKMCFFNHDNILVAIGETPHDVYDGMYNYGIIASNEKYVLPVIIQITQAYIAAGFNPGQKIKKGHEVYSALTKDKDLLAKYDPTFEQRYGRNK